LEIKRYRIGIIAAFLPSMLPDPLLSVVMQRANPSLSIIERNFLNIRVREREKVHKGGYMPAKLHVLVSKFSEYPYRTLSMQ
jgi:hypothetical protein